MSIDLAELKKLASAATPGPWYVVEPLIDWADLGTDPDKWGDITSGPEGDRALSLPDATYIAAVSPDVVLELIAEVERLRLAQGEGV